MNISTIDLIVFIAYCLLILLVGLFVSRRGKGETQDASNYFLAGRGLAWWAIGASLKKENPRKTFLNFRNNLLMLYKNLPDKELEHVLFIRGILDRVAALVFYLKKDRANARAVMQARREFEDIRYSFAASRIENMMKSTDEIIPERTHFSIVMKYYLLGKKHFSQLKLF